MAKDMYQKRKERQEKSNNSKIDNKINVNWDMLTYRQPHSKPYEIRKMGK